jgi:hypothetical protein
MSRRDWNNYLRRRVSLIKTKGKKVTVSKGRVTWADHVNKYGRPYVGIAVRPELIERSREGWEKIEKAVQ